MAEALAREVGLEPFAFCVMPNDWHLVVRPNRDGQLSRFMRWLAQTHTQRWRHAKKQVGEGALYQGRFKSFVVQEDLHFLVLCRYVERNAVRAKLARQAAGWRWCSAAARNGHGPRQGVESADWRCAKSGLLLHGRIGPLNRHARGLSDTSARWTAATGGCGAGVGHRRRRGR